MTTNVLIRHLVHKQNVAIIDILDDTGRSHRITHLFQDGWRCGCPAGRQCEHITEARELVPTME